MNWYGAIGNRVTDISFGFQKVFFFFFFNLDENSVGTGHLAKLPVSDPAHRKVLIMAFVNGEEDETWA